jgi:protein-tyrosine phosphatase
MAAILRIVLICTGNRFRSPLAAAVLQSRVPVPLHVDSLGLYDLGPVPALGEALQAGRRFGLDLSDHRARPLFGQKLAEVDLVLGFERIHVAAAVVDAEAARERSFTLPELVELLEAIEHPSEDDPAVRFRESIRRANDLRAAWTPDASLPEVPDPWGTPAGSYAAIGAQVAGLCERLVELAFGAAAGHQARTRRDVGSAEQLLDG